MQIKSITTTTMDPPEQPSWKTDYTNVKDVDKLGLADPPAETVRWY